MPEREYLGHFWRACEDNLQLIDHNLSLSTLGRAQINALGPHLLGAAAWKLLRCQEFDSWQEFKKLVDDRFGLDERGRGGKLWANVYPQSGEEWPAYIRRLEDLRGEVGGDSSAVYSLVWNLLDPAVRNGLDVHARLFNGNTNPGWKDLVSYANTYLTGGG